MFDRDDWLTSYSEDIIDPEREIVDPHHHLWHWPQFNPYFLNELWADTGSGHNIVQTVYIECGWGYRKEGPDHMKPVGESEFIADIAAQGSKDPTKAQIAGHIAHADLSHPEIDAILDAHVSASKGLIRGIRDQGACDSDPALVIPGHAEKDLFLQSDFQAGVKRLGERGLTFDAWHFHHQIPQLTVLAKAVPDTTIILDHFGTPLGVGAYENKREEIHTQWQRDVAELAKCPNVHAKLGGFAMPDNGWKYNEQDKPATSDQLVADQEKYYHFTIEHFGADRCMFESNFPVDRASISYHVLWNAFKKIAKRYSETEQDAMFRGTARKVYSL